MSLEAALSKRSVIRAAQKSFCVVRLLRSRPNNLFDLRGASTP